MRFFLFLIFLFLFISCGKNNIPSTQSVIKQPQDDEYSTTINEIDLLDVAIDVPIEISQNKIYFKNSEQQIAEGMHSNCQLNVSMEEPYDYKLAGNLLELKSVQGAWRKFLRGSGAPDLLIGTWTNKTIQGSMTIVNRITFVSEGRVIMRSHCES